MKFVCIFILLIFVLFVSGCVQGPVDNNNQSNQSNQSQSNQTRPPAETEAEKFGQSQFGIAVSNWNNYQLTEMKEDMLDAGSHWAGSFLVRWQDIEKVQGTYNWDKLDFHMQESGKQINTLLELRLYNEWANHGGCEYNLAGSPIKPDKWDELEAFLKALLDRVKDKVDYYSIENEMEIKQFWCCTFCTSQEQSADEYVKILKKASEIIRQEDPDAKILLGGFTGNWNSGENAEWPEKTNTNPDFVDRVLEKGKDYFDILDVHLYGEPETYQLRVGWFKSLMAKHGYSKQIWSTEMGGPDIRECFEKWLNPDNVDIEYEIINNDCAKIYHLPENKKDYYKLHAEDVVKRHVQAFDAGVSKTFWWKLYGDKEYDFNDTSYAFQKMSVIAAEKGGRGEDLVNYFKTPGYYSFKIMSEELNMFSSVEKLPIDGEAFLFNVKGKPVLVAWSDDENEIDFSEYFEGTVKIRHIVTGYDSNEKPVYHEDEFLPAESVKIGISPVFISS